MVEKTGSQIFQAFFKHLDITRRAHLGEHVYKLLVGPPSASYKVSLP